MLKGHALNFPHRAGHCSQQPTGYKAFVPAPLQPVPPIAYSGELSSQIEGTQSTLEDVLAFEAEAVRDDTPKTWPKPSTVCVP